MLTFKKITLCGADLGKTSNIADIQKPSAVPFFICDESVGKGEGDNFGKGMVASVLPYRMQNSYNRDFKARQYKAAILENEYLRAEFIPELGGRLWSLYDKSMKRDIIYKNDSLIFANLALRNAWFAGGVEWNIGVRGHTYFTCDSMFARKVKGICGNDILRMYQYEEIRGLVYCLEASLEKDKLLINVTVKNIREEPTYMYWWSNIAVEETEDTRIFVPTDKTFVTSYREGGYRISKIGVPFGNNADISYAKNSKIAIDYFYDLPVKGKKWISGLEKDGRGLLQYSDDILCGRKTFMWGKEPGGYHWNKWLTNNGSCKNSRDYLEIQAGLCKTQFEHFLIAADETLTWKEVYTGIDIGTNEGEYGDICERIGEKVPERLDFGDTFTQAEVYPIEYYGCGKGYLAEKITGKRFLDKCEFTEESITKDEKYYLDLIEGKQNAFGDEDTAYIYGKKWIELIEKKENKNFFDYYIQGVAAYAELDYTKAIEYLEQSVKSGETYYNLCALGLLISNVMGKYEDGFDYIEKAVNLNPEYIPLAVKYGELAIKCGRYVNFMHYYDNSSEVVKTNGRMKMYAGQCLVSLGKLEEAKKYINKDLVVEDVREGEYAISNIWIMLYKKQMAAQFGKGEEDITDADVLAEYPIPYEIDFRMH